MSLLNQVTNRNQDSIPAVRMNVQGTDGVGKSTFASNAERSVIIQGSPYAILGMKS